MFGNYPLKTILHFAKLKIIEVLAPGGFISEENINPNPIKQFEKWYKEVIRTRVPFYDAMTLSTVGKDGKPSARMVLLKSYDERGFVFYTNSNSRKCKELDENQFVALTFYWIRKGKQVRIEGRVEMISAEESDEYFASRPKGSQLGAWASEQSSIIPNRQILIDKVKELEIKYKGKSVQRPPFWNGYRLIPERMEFWQNRINRLHDRIAFTRDDNKQWSHVRLAP